MKLHKLPHSFFLAFFTLASLFSAHADFENGQAPDAVLGTHWVGNQSLFTPQAVAVDAATGKVFVADTGAHRILRYPASVSTTGMPNEPVAEAVFGQPDFNTTDRRTSVTGLAEPTGITVDFQGNLWVADRGNNRVVRFSSAATAASGAAAAQVLGQTNFTSNTPGSGVKMSGPTGITAFGSFLAVADTGNHRAIVFIGPTSLANGAPADRIYGIGLAGINASALELPTAVGIGQYGNAAAPQYRLWVADTGNRRVVRFEGMPAVIGTPYDTVADGVLGAANFTTKGSGQATATTFTPTGLLVSGTRLYVSDGPNFRVLRFDAAAALTAGASATGVLGQTELVNAKFHSIKTPMHLAITSGKLWVADPGLGGVIARFDTPSAVPAMELTSSKLTGPSTPAPNPDATDVSAFAECRTTGKFFVCSQTTGTIRRYTSAATFRGGQPHEIMIGGPSPNGIPLGLNRPSGLALCVGSLIVADTDNHRLLVFDQATTTTTNQPPPSAVVGQANFITNTHSSDIDRFRGPTALSVLTKEPTVNATHELLVADTLNHRVLLYKRRVLGTEPWVRHSLQGAGMLNTPRGVAWASRSNSRFWVADTGNNRVIRFDTAFASDPPDLVLGQSLGRDVNRLSSPTSLALSETNEGYAEALWIADAGNQRVIRFPVLHVRSGLPPPRTTADRVIGAVDFTAPPFTFPGLRGLAEPQALHLEIFPNTQAASASLWVSDPAGRRVQWYHRPADPTPAVTEWSTEIVSPQTPQATRRCHLTFRARPEFQYLVQSSTDLLHWTAGDRKDGGNGPTLGLDPITIPYFKDVALAVPKLYFRVLEVPPQPIP